MNIRGQATFQAGDFSRLEAAIVPRIKAAVEQATDAVYEESQVLVPVRTGQLHDTADTEFDWQGHNVMGYVVYPAEYAAYVEFGTGARGASSPGAGPYEYTMEWPGMAAQPYLRPALDNKRPEIMAAFTDQGFTI